MGVVLWDGTEHWLFPLQKVGNKGSLGQQIAGMNQGDLGSFQNILDMAHGALQKSTANLKHIIIFSDGDPGAPTRPYASHRGRPHNRQHRPHCRHAGPETMMSIAQQGKGRFYNVTSPMICPRFLSRKRP